MLNLDRADEDQREEDDGLEYPYDLLTKSQLVRLLLSMTADRAGVKRDALGESRRLFDHDAVVKFMT